MPDTRIFSLIHSKTKISCKTKEKHRLTKGLQSLPLTLRNPDPELTPDRSHQTPHQIVRISKTPKNARSTGKSVRHERSIPARKYLPQPIKNSTEASRINSQEKKIPAMEKAHSETRVRGGRKQTEEQTLLKKASHRKGVLPPTKTKANRSETRPFLRSIIPGGSISTLPIREFARAERPIN